MVLGSGSHSRSQVSVANRWVNRILRVLVIQSSATAGLADRNRLAVSHRRGTVLLITAFPRTVDPRVPPLNSIMLDQRRG